MATYTVTTTSDVVDSADGQLSLREALALADVEAATADTIEFAPDVQGGRIVLAGSQLTVNSDVTIDGGAAVTIDANQQSRVLLVQGFGTAVDLRHLTVSGGRTSGERDSGAGILASGYASLTLDHTTVRDNVTEGAYASGGGVFTGRTRFSVGEPLLLVNTTVSGNRTLGEHALGGGIFSYNATLTNSTITGNSTTGEHASGGGIDVGEVFGRHSLDVINSTVSGNSTAGGYAVGGGISSGNTTTIINSIIAGNEAGGGSPDVAGGIRASNGLNVFGSAVEGAAPGDAQNVLASMLFAGGLGNNGGFTETIALRDATDNPALGRADPALAPTTDQRDEARPAPEGTQPDIGAFELNQTFAVPPPVATTFVVTARNDVVDPLDGQVSLREALALADTDGTTVDRVEFSPEIQGGTIFLTGGQLVANSDFTIDGGLGVTIDAQQASRVLRVQGFGTDVVLNNLTLTNGHTSGDREGGGGVFADRFATLTLNHTTVSGNSTAGSAADGGGIFAYSATLIDSLVSGNSATGSSEGGGIAGGFGSLGDESGAVTLTSSTVSANHASGPGGGISSGTVTLTASTVSGNASQGSGGGIYATGPVTLTDSRISNNVSQDFGGGIHSAVGALALTNSTVSGNSTAGIYGHGGGIAGGEMTLNNSTVCGNSTLGRGADGGGISAAGLVVTLIGSTISGNSASGDGGGINAPSFLGPLTTVADTIIAGNVSGGAAPDFGGRIVTSNGHNVFGSNVDGTAAGDLQNVPASLLFAAIDPATGGGQLADNGGPTQTIALRDVPDNPALAGADPTAAPTTDQRGEVRAQPEGTSPDIGAFELNQTGGGGLNEIVGTPHDDFLHGTAGADLIRGLAGNDRLWGRDGNDQLFGGRGCDVLAGKQGIDQMTGGAGADRFLFRRVCDSPADGLVHDVIQDFRHAQHDQIDLRPIDARLDRGGNQQFSFVGDGPFTRAGQLRLEATTDGDFLVSGNVDRDLDADFAVIVRTDLAHLHAADFLL